MSTSLKSTVDTAFDMNTSTTMFAALICCALIPVAWVRNFAKFSFTFIAGNLLILVVIIMLLTQSSMQLWNHGVAPGIEFVKYDGVLPMIGFVIYAFEGIGVVMPIMSQAAEPESFLKMLMSAIISLTCIYIVFGCVAYLAYGDTLTIICTEMFPPGYVAALIKILFCLNLIFSYSIIIHPTNAIIEGWLFAGLKSKPARKWSKNISRAIIVILAACIAIALEDNLEKFLGILGALLCGPLAMTIPCALHLKVLAKTPT